MTPPRNDARGREDPKPKRAYHHADLRRALMDAAVLHLRDQDVTRLTMQGLARAAGVSPGAPYHHFADKQAVIAAVATEGYEQWLARAQRALEEVPSSSRRPESELAALAQGWLDFAEAYPAHYRVMFLPEFEDRVRFADVHEAAGRGLALLLDVVSRGLPRVDPETTMTRGVVAWATVHGVASLRNAGVLGNMPGLPQASLLDAEAVEQVLTAAFREMPGA